MGRAEVALILARSPYAIVIIAPTTSVVQLITADEGMPCERHGCTMILFIQSDD